MLALLLITLPLCIGVTMLVLTVMFLDVGFRGNRPATPRCRAEPCAACAGKNRNLAARETVRS
jgi:hypothetical protein